MSLNKKDQKEVNEKSLNFYKGNCSKNIYLNDDSGYSSDSSSASASSLRLFKYGSCLVSNGSLNFPTPDVNWKSKLRYNSTPLTSTKCEAKDAETLSFTPIEGPLLRRKTFPIEISCSPSLELNLSLNIPTKSEALSSSISQTVKEKLGKITDKKCYMLLRSPLNSPFKLNKKQKNAEDIATSSKDIFSDLEVKQWTVKSLFCSKAESTILTPLRRVSPQLSNIFTHLMDNASYILPSILSFLSDKDLLSVSHVCHQLRCVVHDTSYLNSRRMFFLDRNKKTLEQLGKENTKNKSISSNCDHSLTISSPRKHLQQLQNSCSSLQKISPKPFSRFDKFVKEGKKLPPGETQQKCIHCQNPAHTLTSESKAVCTSESCGSIYCTRCLLPFHEKASDCLALKPKPKMSTASKILSKACKKRLRRL